MTVPLKKSLTAAVPGTVTAGWHVKKKKASGMNNALILARPAICFGAFLLLALSACSVASSSPAARPSRLVMVGVNPQEAALDLVTRTWYVESDPENNTDGSVTVLSASTCNAHRSSGCVSSSPTVQVGNGPVAMAIDQVTDTIYVVNSNSDTVSVINGATCNAQDSSGCQDVPPVVHVGSNPVDVSVDQATGTVYVANWGNGTGTTVSVIDGRACNGQVATGCKRRPATVTIGRSPAGLMVDPATDTIYAATVTSSGAAAVSVIDGAACNASMTTGCHTKPPSVAIGRGSANYNVAFAIDQATRTLYVSNWHDNALSMIDTATCNAVRHSGCGTMPPTVTVGAGPDGIAIDQVTHTVYVADVTSDTLSVVDAATCNATDNAGCTARPTRRLRTGSSPHSVIVDADTGTIYVTNGDDGTASILSADSCNARVTSGCK
jgi:YVTN family beta-propeller protein